MRSLPRDTPGFLNRDQEIAQVMALLQKPDGRKLWLTGLSGVGKTCLAVRLGHLLAAGFPDGVLYAELRGSDRIATVDPRRILRRFLRLLGKSESEIPDDVDDLTADFRAMTADKRVLVILDDVGTSGQIGRLQPSSATSAVIVTSRKHVDGLVFTSFNKIEVTGFTVDTATELLGQVVTPARLTAEPAATARLISGCAGLPLAVQILGVRLARSERSLEWFAGRLEQAPLDQFRLSGEISVEEIFDLTYDEFDEETQRAYGLLSLAGAHFDTPTAAAVLGRLDPEDLLDDLTNAHLLERMDVDRYRFHALVGDHARARAAELPADELDAAARRRVTYRRRRARALSTVVARRWTVVPVDDAPPFEGPDAEHHALAELEMDEPLFRADVSAAAELDMRVECFEIVEALKPWYYNTDRLELLLKMLGIAKPAVDDVGDPVMAMRLHNDLGSATEGAGKFKESLAEYEKSRENAVRAGHRLGEASAVEGAGLALRGLGEPEQAIDRYRKARTILAGITPTTQDEEDQVKRALKLLDLHEGTDLESAGGSGEALLIGAEEWFKHKGELVNQARALDALAAARERAGDVTKALDLLATAGTCFDSAGYRSKYAETLVSRARIEARSDVAEDLLGQARALFERLGMWRRAAEISTRS